MNTEVTKPKVLKSEFIKLVETNTKAQVAEHYGLSEKDITKIAGQLKVKFNKRKPDNFVIVDDLESVSGINPIMYHTIVGEMHEEVEQINAVIEPVNIINTSVPVEQDVNF